MTKEEVKEIAYIAWKGAANAYRMYPDNKHTFTEYWSVAESQFNKFCKADVSVRSELLIAFAHHLKNIMTSGKSWSIESAVERYESEQLNKPDVSGSVAVEDALAFAEYFRNNFDYYDCNSNGRVYKWIDLKKRGSSAMTMKQIFEYWQSHSN